MEAERMKQLILLGLRTLSSRVALVGGNHTAARPGSIDRFQFGVSMAVLSAFAQARNVNNKHKQFVGGVIDASSVDSENQVVIKLPNARVLRVLARSVLLALLILAFPWMGSILGPFDVPSVDYSRWIDDDTSAFLPELFRDLVNNGLMKPQDRVLFVGGPQGGFELPSVGLEMDLNFVSQMDLERQSSVPDETFDLTYSVGLGDADRDFITRTLKIGGVAAVRLSRDPAKAFVVPPNFSIAYVRRFDATIVGIKKMPSSASARRLLSYDPAAMKEALKKLEDALLEPPRSSSAKESKLHLRRIKYLPELTGVSLDEYPRRVFIAVGSSSEGWFERNYPVMNRDFERHRVRTVAEGGPLGMSEWLRRNVREEEYVVMQAEAEVVEEMVESKAIRLVDELFLECEHEGQKGGKGRKKKSRRPYWECLSLYGKLRDEGVAVHQWWGSSS
ncbi:hypothetical protein H6P81_010768 [Aristolochia fimbriata]|uniref:DUF7870 domain-containing protein n=1 Tax=Aristolochia fimbriata TaxID=158543 RepID=A0AAV7EPP9_ARIFI|nr:hypothetical protein H6P81_010768 [Aristolochia fimbriata]